MWRIVGAVILANLVLGGLLAMIGTFAVEIIYNMAVATTKGCGIRLETFKLFGLIDTLYL